MMRLNAALDSEILVVAWLSPIITASVQRWPDDPLPFALVQRVAGAESDEVALDVHSIQVDVFGDSIATAQESAMKVHHRMKVLNMARGEVPALDGSVFKFDYCFATQTPVRITYEAPKVFRYISRYSVGLTHRTIQVV